jgi:hypothetical protein
MPAPKGHPPYNVNGEGGRPLKFTQEFIEKEADALEEWSKVPSNMFLSDFCHPRGYLAKKISEFEKDNERFREALIKFKEKQRDSLFKGGLSKKFNYNMCQLILGHAHGVYAKTEQSVNMTANVTTNSILELDGATKDIVNDA